MSVAAQTSRDDAMLNHRRNTRACTKLQVEPVGATALATKCLNFMTD
jgi:hypothetical protein